MNRNTNNPARSARPARPATIASALCLIPVLASAMALAQNQNQTLEFRLNPDWPQIPLGENWLTGGIGGICVDQRDHVFLLNRQNVVEDDLDGARLAPPVIELDPQGAVVNGWGDAELLGGRLHDCLADAAGDLWIVPAATGHIQKYDPTNGELLMQIGESGVFDSSDGSRGGEPLNSDLPRFFLPSAVDSDDDGNLYVADGELPGGNTRIAVLDRDGNFLRQWRLRREPGEEDLIELPHCIRVSDDGLVYVCDRRADRIQVFNLEGEFQRHIPLGFTPLTDPAGRASGARGNAVVLEFSPDAEQRHLYVVNQNSVTVEVLDRRSGEKLAGFGHGPGRYPGQFELPHGIAVDSRGNVYIAEQEGRRVQQFQPVGR